MVTQHSSRPPAPARARSRPRDSNGVIAVLERLTGVTPYSNDLRHCANKYLRSALFPVPHGKKISNKQKLAEDGAQTLLMNALDLDEIFQGDTTLVVKILRGEINPAELEGRIQKATRTIEQRHKIYADSRQKVPAVASQLRGEIDFKQVRIVTEPQQTDLPHDDAPSMPFALRAVRMLESLEQGRRRQHPSASELVQQADAYLALNDTDAAAIRAREAIELEPRKARARFILVVALLKQRDQSLSQRRRHLLEATELADPMSAHERSARSAADAEANKASSLQDQLDLVVPEALLNWPTGAWGQYEHADWRLVVVGLMLAQAFRKIQIGGELGESQLGFELNGLAEEWQLKLNAQGLQRSAGDPPPEPPLVQAERDALAMLFAEHTRHGWALFDPRQQDHLAREFRLLHLRWILGDNGYERHWQSWTDHADSAPPSHFERFILRDATLAPLWFSHCTRHGGVAKVQAAMDQWRNRSESASRQNSATRALELQVLAFHHQFARHDFMGCRQICDQAEELIAGNALEISSARHPLESSVTVPSGSTLYWQYLRALAVVCTRASKGQLDEEATVLLAEADLWRQRFQDQKRCFWLQSEEYEDGGGEDFHTAAYDIDLCKRANWLQPMRNRDLPFQDFDVYHPQLGQFAD
jgi:hypothetical protein